MEEIKQKLLEELAAAGTPQEVDAVRVGYLGKKGTITTLRKNTDFRAMTPEQRKSFGQEFNQLKTEAEQRVAEAIKRAKEAGAATSGGKGALGAGIDLSLPGAGHRVGSLHPITLVQMELEQIFHGMGFMSLTGPEVEHEHHNFDALNIPADHPARDMQDTYWLENGMLLRTHTSPNQVRAMEKFGVPLRAIFPGRCFRYESVDATHENTFYQLEGLMVDRNISTAHLIAVMKALLSQVFKKDVTVRLRPGFFPFVEPGFELDIQCLLCGGEVCSTCKTGWIELLPCGLVHPRVLKAGGVDPEEYTGFAFGLGLTRLAMMKFGIPEIRLLNAGDIRFLSQFPAGV